MSDKSYHPIQNKLIDAARIGLITIAWLAALCTVMFGSAVQSLSEVGVYCFILFAICTLPRLRRDSLIILTVLAVLTLMLLPMTPDLDALLGAVEYVLIFAALLPTMALVKATAITMPSVQRSQANLSALPSEASAGGFQLTGHFFGGIINTGTFAILSAVLPQAGAGRRAAGAAIRE